MKKYFLFLILFLTATARAETFIAKSSTVSQDVQYVTNQLTQILKPAGYELIPESVDFEDGVAVPGMSRPVILYNLNFLVKSVNFKAKAVADQKIWEGDAYLVIFSSDGSVKFKDSFNSTAEKKTGKFGDFTFVLTAGYENQWFSHDMRINDLNLHPPF